MDAAGYQSVWPTTQLERRTICDDVSDNGVNRDHSSGPLAHLFRLRSTRAVTLTSRAPKSDENKTHDSKNLVQKLQKLKKRYETLDKMYERIQLYMYMYIMYNYVYRYRKFSFVYMYIFSPV